MGFQTAFICESDLVFVQVQIGFVFDTALAFVFDGNVQLAILSDKDDKRPSETRWDFRRPLFASRI